MFRLETERHWIAQTERRIKREQNIKGLNNYGGLENDLNRFCSLGIYDYFKSSIDVSKGRSYDLDDLKKGLGIAAKYDKFYQFMIDVLREDGFVDTMEQRVRFLKDPREFVDFKTSCEALETSYRAFKGLFSILRHCVAGYRQALSGKIPAISVLYPDGGSHLLEESTRDTAEYEEIRVYQLLAQEVIGKLLSQSNNKPLRILEVGGGWGIFTRSLTPTLQGKNVEYHFTDVGRWFVVQAKRDAEKNRFDFMRFGVLDISRDGQRQGYETFSFDLIIGLNVVHATPRIDETVKNLKNLLKPNGMLLLIESVKPYRWHNMVWGLAEGWWHFNDTDLRTGFPLLSPEIWERALLKAGFEAGEVFPQDKDARLVADSVLIVAQQSAADAAGNHSGATRPAATETRRGAEERDADIGEKISTSDWTDDPGDRCIHELIEAQAARTPERVAVAWEERRLTYGELNRKANRLARRLRSLGVGPEATVGICLERSLEVIIALLAVLKAGGAYVPLDLSYPTERLQFILEDSKAAVLLTQRALGEKLPGHHAHVVCLDEEPKVFDHDSEQNPHVTIGPGNLAYVIYTSGSTGTPKGVLVPHRNLVRSTRARILYYSYPVDAFLLLSSFAFDSSVAGIFWTLCQGGRLVLPRQGLEKDPTAVQALIAKNHVSHMLSLPSLYGLLLEGAQPENLSSLRTVIVAGETCPSKLAGTHLRLAPQASLFNEYGPTEGTVWSSVHAVSPNGDAVSVPIGHPIAGVRIYLLDRRLRPAPMGVAGELYIGGAGVARGYRNRPELTAERFIPDPFSGESGARLYRTGDLGRRLAGGAIEFLGRIDQQVKIRGFRIEPGEIEAVLAQHPSIRESVVLAREDEPGELRLVAYMVPRPGQAPTLHELRSFVQQKLPEQMTPWAFVLLEALPLTPNGKIDRRALPAPSRERPALAQPYAAPRNELEQWLAGIWCETLQLDSVGIHDKFFELGGSSLQAARLINRLQEKLGESVFVVALFDAPSIAEFAEFLQAHYAHVLARRFPAAFSHQRADSIPMRDRTVDGSMVARMRECVPALAPSDGKEESPWQCRRAVFILAPPRSGTTLLRVMLAGHPDLFAAPELQLLGFHTLRERKTALSGRFALWLEGAQRAVMELKRCDADEAKRIVEKCERQSLTTKEFYRLLQDWSAPRTLVDKTPSYALDIEALRKAERDFADALYIHLVRHPYAVVRSFEADHLDQALFLREHDFSPRELGELVWTVSHQNTLEFLSSIPPERQVRMRFEELTRAPRTVMEEMCERFALPFHPDLLDPYRNREHKMIDGLYEASTPMGDRKFLEYNAINPQAAESWRTVAGDDFLGQITWEVAERLGYERPVVAGDSVREENPAAYSADRIGISRLERQRQIRAAHREMRSKE